MRCPLNPQVRRRRRERLAATAVERGRAVALVGPVRLGPAAIRLALWYFAGGGPLSADWLAAPPPRPRCVAATCPILAPLPGRGLAESRFRPAAAVRTAGHLTIVLTRVELELPEIAVTVEEFLTAAKDCEADVEVVDVPLGRHGFETIGNTGQTRGTVRAGALAELKGP